MSCCGGYCDCGPDCKCGSGGGCNMHTDISESTTTATVIVGVRPSKAYFVDAVMGFGAENDCKCGSGCSCDDCTCGCKK